MACSRVNSTFIFTQRNLLGPPQILHGRTLTWTQVFTLRDHYLATKAMIQPSTNKARSIHTALFAVVQPRISIGRYKHSWPWPSKYSHNQRNSHCQYDENLKPNTAKYIIRGLRLNWHCWRSQSYTIWPITAMEVRRGQDLYEASGSRRQRQYDPLKCYEGITWKHKNHNKTRQVLSM